MALAGGAAMGAMGGGAMPGPIALGGGGAGSLAFGGMPSMPAPPGAPPMAAQSAPQQQAGGAYDLRGRGPEEAEDDDHHACLGLDITGNYIRAWVCIKGESIDSITGNSPATLVVDPVTGAKAARKWVSKPDRRKSLPKGISLGSGVGALPSSPMRLLGLRSNLQALSREKLHWGDTLIVDSSTDLDTLGLKIALRSPKAEDDKDKEYACEVEMVLAMLLAGMRSMALREWKVNCKTCVIAVPACFLDGQRVALQRAVFSAGMTPVRFVGSSIAQPIGNTWDSKSGCTVKGFDPDTEEVIACVNVGASSTDIGIIRRRGTCFTALATGGSPYLGEDEIDMNIMEAAKEGLEKKGWNESSDGGQAIVAIREARAALEKKKDATASFGGGKYKVTLTLDGLQLAQTPLAESLSVALRAAVLESGVARGLIKTVYTGGACLSSPALKDAVIASFPEASTFLDVGAYDVAKGASMLSASSRGLLSSAATVKAIDIVAARTMLVEEVEGDLKTVEIFPIGTHLPASFSKTFEAESGRKAPQYLRAMQASPAGGEDLVIGDIGNPLLAYDERDFPVMAKKATLELLVDEYGVLTHSSKDIELPVKKDYTRFWRLVNIGTAVLAIVATTYLGYLKLDDMANARGRQEADARLRLTSFYERENPEKLDTIEETIRRYSGRFDTLYKRLEDKYGVRP